MPWCVVTRGQVARGIGGRSGHFLFLGLGVWERYPLQYTFICLQPGVLVVTAVWPCESSLMSVKYLSVAVAWYIAWLAGLEESPRFSRITV